MRIEVHHYHHIPDPDRLEDLIEDAVERALRNFLSACNWPCRYEDNRPVSGTIYMSKTLNIGGISTTTVTYQDKAGSNVPVVGAPTWAVDNSAIATVVPAADGLSAVVTGVAVGTATVTVTAEGDATPGVDTITLTGTVNVVDEATGGTLIFS